MEQAFDESKLRRPPAETSSSPLGGFRIFRVAGIDIRIDPSWFLIFGLITFTLHAGLRGEHPGLAGSSYWLAALAGSLLFFGSILVHELSHSLVARAQGTHVHGIVLFLFGGMSGLKDDPKNASDEAAVAAVGPFVSVLLGGLFLLLGVLWPGEGLVDGLFGWLGFINLLLAGFNLLPGLPLDGGRLLRAGVWALSGDLRKATRVAAAAGSGIAILLVVLGLLQILFVPRAMIGGLWLVFIGWFLLSAARRSGMELDLRRGLARLRVADAMRQDCVQVAPEETVDRLVEDRMLKPGPRCFIVAREGAMEGLLTLEEIRRTPRDRWPLSTASDIMVPAENVRSVPPDATLLEALDRMQASNVNQLPVVEGGRLQGLLTREDLLRALSLHLELSPRS